MDKLSGRNGAGRTQRTQAPVRHGGQKGGGSHRKLKRSLTAPSGRGGKVKGQSLKSRQMERKMRISQKSPPRSSTGSARNHKAGSSKYMLSARDKAIQKGARGAGIEFEKEEKKKRVVKKPTGMQKCCRKYCGGGPTNVHLESDQALATQRRLRLTGGDLRRLRASFNMIDYDESGEIDYDEFLE